MAAGVALVCALVAVGCGGSDTALRKRSTPASAMIEADSSELTSLDERLDSLTTRADSARMRLDELQARVAEKMGDDSSMPSASLELAGSQMYVEIDQRSLIRVNGISMNRNDIDAYLNTQGKSLCQPVPVMAVHQAASADTTIWVLERIYGVGCSDVEILEIGNEQGGS